MVPLNFLKNLLLFLSFFFDDLSRQKREQTKPIRTGSWCCLCRPALAKSSCAVNTTQAHLSRWQSRACSVFPRRRSRGGKSPSSAGLKSSSSPKFFGSIPHVPSPLPSWPSVGLRVRCLCPVALLLGQSRTAKVSTTAIWEHKPAVLCTLDNNRNSIARHVSMRTPKINTHRMTSRALGTRRQLGS